MLVLSGIVLGFGASLFFIGCSTYILRIAEYRGQSMGIFNGMVSTGAGLAGLTGGYFLLKNSFSPVSNRCFLFNPRCFTLFMAKKP